MFIKNVIQFWCTDTYSQVLSRKTKFSVLFGSTSYLCKFDLSLLIAIETKSRLRLDIKDDMRNAGVQYSFSFQRNNTIKTTVHNKLKTKKILCIYPKSDYSQ